MNAGDRYAITISAQDVRGRPHDPDWEVLDAQPLPTTPEVVAAPALMLAAPPGMLAAGSGFVLVRHPDASSGRSWGLVALLATLALVAYATAGIAGPGRLRGGAHRRHGARQRVHQRAAAVSIYVLAGLLILAALYTATLVLLASML